MPTWSRRRSRCRRPTRPTAASEQAALALSQTYETASRGILYEHSARTAAAQRLAGAMKPVIEADRANGARISDHDIAGVLRRVEAGAREARGALDDGDEERAYLSMLKRVWASVGAGSARDADAAGQSPSGGLILPP